MFKQFFILGTVLALLLAPARLSAQERTVIGVVTDSEDQPVIGATVMAGSGNATITDVIGAFNLNVPEDCKYLTISSIGFKTVEYPIQGKSLFPAPESALNA